jgi:hypothetical protein
LTSRNSSQLNPEFMIPSIGRCSSAPPYSVKGSWPGFTWLHPAMTRKVRRAMWEQAKQRLAR